MLNKKLLPLKVTLFGYAGAAFSVLPYLTIHMKDIGIRQENQQFLTLTSFFSSFLFPAIWTLPSSTAFYPSAYSSLLPWLDSWLTGLEITRKSSTAVFSSPESSTLPFSLFLGLSQ